MVRTFLLALPLVFIGCTSVYVPTAIPVADPEVPAEVWLRYSGVTDGEAQAALAIGRGLSVVGGVSGANRPGRADRGRVSAYGGLQYAEDRFSVGAGGGWGSSSACEWIQIGGYDTPCAEANHVRGYGQIGVPLLRGGSHFVLRTTMLRADQIACYRCGGSVQARTVALVEPMLVLRGDRGRVGFEGQTGFSYPFLNEPARSTPDFLHFGGVFASVGVRVQLGPSSIVPE